jgi:hypothetical protein
MKIIIIIGFLLLKFNFSFSQIPFSGIEGLKDTSNFPELRSQLKIQSLAIELDSTYVPAYFKRAALTLLANARRIAGQILFWNICCSYNNIFLLLS